MKFQTYRHGDVALDTVSEVPKTAKLMDKKVCRCASHEVCAQHLVLAHGEVSGHAHRFDYTTDKIDFYEDTDGTIYTVNRSRKSATLAQTNGTTSAFDLAHLEKCYQAEGLHAPIKDALKKGEVKKVEFPQEFNWAKNEIERARD